MAYGATREKFGLVCVATALARDVTVLILLLVASGVIGYLGWTSGGDADVPTSGYVAMAFGVIFSLAVGIGLMALIFYSSRKGYDEPAVLIQEPSVDPDDVQKKPATKP